MTNKYDDMSEEELIQKLDRGFMGPEDLKDIVSAMEAKGMKGGLIGIDEDDPMSEKVAKQYIDYHKNISTSSPTSRMVKKAIKQLLIKNITDKEIKEIILILAHSGNVKALRALEKFSKKSEGELRQWAQMGISECKMFLESELLDRAKIKVEDLSNTNQSTSVGKSSATGRLFEYLFSNQEEVEKAIEEFFDNSSIPKNTIPFENEAEEDLFADWIVFDYRLSSGSKLIESFIREFGDELSEKDRNSYEEMQFNKYGLFEVKRIMLDEWIDLESISTSKVYRVKEKMGTYGTSVGRLLIGRLGKQDGQWRIIGSNPIEVPVHLSKGAKQCFAKIKDLSPKFFRGFAKKIKYPDQKQ
ncbi:MAG: hypothetical protein NTZ65_01430 [Candidatus Berkelbacteria bacterium]|nr:hypothetical protein [Candidatus Berkelbacteria bacterium]